MKIRYIFPTFIILLFSGCTKKTNVVLLNSGKAQNAIIIATDKGSSKLDKTGSFVSIYRESKSISKKKFMSENEIKNLYGTLFKAMPKKPKSYILYFKPNSKILTKESKITLQKALRTIEEYSPCVVDIIGHTDTVGSNDINVKVSLKRAEYVKSLIIKTKFTYNQMKDTRIETLILNTKGYGEEDLLIKTADNVSEAKNRNVEIFIK
jgi:outer membrane protein OmpA-like peptidoglycan-associated protein